MTFLHRKKFPLETEKNNVAIMCVCVTTTVLFARNIFPLEYLKEMYDFWNCGTSTTEVIRRFFFWKSSKISLIIYKAQFWLVEIYSSPHVWMSVLRKASIFLFCRNWNVFTVWVHMQRNFNLEMYSKSWRIPRFLFIIIFLNRERICSLEHQT